ncbi:unnamed protein product [Oikopleura dioica]|uniref:Uncharacterized protein n=1 Tax=Oikopleura dioica TaxID=34765 RepID=E4X212_OIKDI|nr:unnamed protein product [Oikopleura dioica]
MATISKLKLSSRLISQLMRNSKILEQLACVIKRSKDIPQNVQASPNLILFPHQATVVSVISPFKNITAGCQREPSQVIQKRSSLFLQMNKSPVNFRQKIKLTLKGDFKHIFNLISPKGQLKLVRGNCHSPNVLRTLTYKDFMRFELDRNDLRVALSLSLQEKQKEIGNLSDGEGLKEDALVSLPRTVITALPIRSKVKMFPHVESSGENVKY